eukprot:4296588-Pyramimonas_sp.AAC.1
MERQPWGRSWAKSVSVSAASPAGPPGRDPADTDTFAADAPRGTYPYDPVSGGSRPGIQTARARICSPL